LNSEREKIKKIEYKNENFNLKENFIKILRELEELLKE
jgi:hypothetical protein